MRFRFIMTATVLALLVILFVAQTPGIAQKKTKQGNRATGQVGEIVSGAIGGVVVALVDGILGIAKSVIEVPQSRHQPSRSTKAR
jgi:uncharacterized membrane protein YeaQ/YmgE (transglycosylase-associated protein family)